MLNLAAYSTIRKQTIDQAGALDPERGPKNSAISTHKKWATQAEGGQCALRLCDPDFCFKNGTHLGAANYDVHSFFLSVPSNC